MQTISVTFDSEMYKAVFRSPIYPLAVNNTLDVKKLYNKITLQQAAELTPWPASPRFQEFHLIRVEILPVPYNTCIR